MIQWFYLNFKSNLAWHGGFKSFIGWASFTVSNLKKKDEIRDRCANYDIIIWFQAYWDKIVV